MPELTLEEADRCPYCDSILRTPPNCCDEAIEDSEDQWINRLMDNWDDG